MTESTVFDLALPTAPVREILERAFAEDAPAGDITSQLLIAAEAKATAVLNARVPGVFSGATVFRDAMLLIDPDTDVELLLADGDTFDAGTHLARVSGRARSVLLAERVALNLVQRMSAIATKTAEFVKLTEGTTARITDTRKTTPGLRVLERFAVRCGGGANHRYSLSDAVLAKDNHLAVMTGGDPAKLTVLLAAAKAQLGHTTHFEVEVDSIDQIEPVRASWPCSTRPTSPCSCVAPAPATSTRSAARCRPPPPSSTCPSCSRGRWGCA